MWIEIGTPASLPLGLVRFKDEREDVTCLMGVTLQHPPVQLFAQPQPSLTLTGARADKGNEQAQRFLQQHGLGSGSEIEVEIAIPEGMGLSSEAMLGLTIARALAWANNLPFDDAPALANAVGLGAEDALPIWGFAQGGFLLVETAATGGGSVPRPVRRCALEHKEQAEAWPFVLLMPRLGPNFSGTLEADRLAQLMRAAPYLSPETGHLLNDVLWPAMEADDIGAFAGALMAIQQLNYEALERAGTPYITTDEQQGMLDLMRENGALAWGRSLTGLALYGVVRGANASIDLRQKMTDRAGLYGGWVMASITDNHGARHTVWDRHPILV
jgi:predicted sugar kinase